MARHSHGRRHGRPEKQTYKMWQRLGDRCYCLMVRAAVELKLFPMPLICHRSPTKQRTTRRSRKTRALHRTRKIRLRSSAGNGERYSVAAAYSQRYRPGVDQEPFRFKRRRSKPLPSEFRLFRLGSIAIMERVDVAEQLKSEVRTNVIILSLSLTGAGSMQLLSVRTQRVIIYIQAARIIYEDVLNVVHS